MTEENRHATDDADEQLADYDAWFRRKVRRSLEELDRGEFLTHEDIGGTCRRRNHLEALR